MSIARFSVKNSLFVNFLSFLLLVMGIVAAFVTRKEAFPNVKFDYAQIQTFYPGATSEDVEKYVTIPLEKEIREVSGIEELISDSRENLSYILVKIDPDLEKEKVVDDIQKAVDRVGDLPEEVKEDPLVEDIDFEEIPVIEFCLAGLPERELQYYVEVFEDRLRDVPGVARTIRRGWRDTEVWVEIDPEKARELYVSYDEIIEALGRRNVSMPAGKFTAGGREFHVRTSGEFRTAEEVEDIIIRSNDAGNHLRIRDMALVTYGFEDENIINSTYGKRSVNLIVVKREHDDAIEVVSAARGIIENLLEETPEGLIITEADDLSYYIRRRLNVLRRNAVVGLLLVISTLLVFLSRRVAFLTALGLAIAFSFSIFVIGAFDISINLISMFGLIVVLGMLVDDGIIIAENCYRYIEDGYEPRDAAVRGTEEVTKPVTAAVLTTIVASCPLLFMSGMLGRFVREIPIVVIVALAISLFEALVILPSHIADFVPAVRKSGGIPLSKKEAPWFKNILAKYTSVITLAIHNRYKVILAVICMFAFFVVIAYAFMDFELFSSEGVEIFFARLEAEPGTTREATKELIKPVEKLIEELPESELDNYVTQVGMIGEDRSIGMYMRLGSHLAQITVYLTPPEARRREAGEIIQSLRDKVKKIEGAKVTFEEVSPGPPVGRAIEYKIRGEKYDVLKEIAGKYKDYLATVEGVEDIDDDYEYGKEEIRIVVDKDRAREAGVTVSDIAKTARSVFKGNIATSIKPEKAEEEIDVLVRMKEVARDDEDVFERILVRNGSGKLIPLKNIAAVEKTAGMYFIRHIDGKKAIQVYADIDEDLTTSNAVNSEVIRHFKGIENEYLGYTVTSGGEYEEQMKSVKSLVIAFLLAFFLIFMILSSSFNSIVQPLVIMLAIPFGIIGVIVGFLVHRMPLSFMSLLGIVFLTGIVVNDSIVLVDFVNKLRRSGAKRRESIIKAGQLRLRPVLLTTITTVLGLAPVAYAIGGGDPILIPMAMAICWGLLFSTALTLVVIPCIYAVIDDFVNKILNRPTVICK